MASMPRPTTNLNVQHNRLCARNMCTLRQHPRINCLPDAFDSTDARSLGGDAGQLEAASALFPQLAFFSLIGTRTSSQ